MSDRNFLKRASVYVRGEFIRSMSAGKDPRGNRLARPAIWARIAGQGRGSSAKYRNAVPLLNTGSLRANMGEVARDDASLEFGWRGRFADIAYRQINGIAGEMKVREKGIKGLYSGIRTAKAGHNYIRVKNGSEGQWITKRVVSGAVRVRPRPRDFFFLSWKQAEALAKLRSDML